jgi:ribonuclease HI
LDGEAELCGNVAHGTNNRMEMEAAIAALAYLQGRHGRCQVDLYTDSRYLRQGITAWIDDWFARGWKAKNGLSIKNQDLWRCLYELTHAHDVQWHWVKGHAGDPLNERVDRLAGGARVRLAGNAACAPGTAPEAAPHVASDPVALSIGASCRGGRGPGGWAVVVRAEGRQQVLRGRARETTGNRLYVEAATAGLRALETPTSVTVQARSDYLVQGASQWAPSWQQRGWRNSKGAPIKNQEQWAALLAAAQPHQVTWRSVKGRDLTDDLAEAARVASAEAAQAG